MAQAEQTEVSTRTTSIVLPEDVELAVKKFQRDDMRPTFTNAVVALIVDGLEVNRRRRPRRSAMDPEPAS